MQNSSISFMKHVIYVHFDFHECANIVNYWMQFASNFMIAVKYVLNGMNEKKKMILYNC